MSLAEVQTAGPDAPARLVVNGAELWTDLSGALYWPERRLVLVADLHLEKGSAFAVNGRFLPPYDTAATLARLQAILRRYEPCGVICVGDSFHDGDAAARLSEVDETMLRALTRRYDWTWIAGNHDPAPAPELGGRVVEETTIGPLVIRHEAKARGLSGGEISGHFHPKASVRVRNKRISARCFVSDGRRVILPAFGAYTGGLNVLDPAIATLFRKGFQARLLGRERIFAFPSEVLVY